MASRVSTPPSTAELGSSQTFQSFQLQNASIRHHNAMPGKLIEWPAWREFGTKPAAEDKRYEDKDFLEAKQAVIREYGEERLRASWISVCKQLESVTDEIAKQRNNRVPIFEADNILSRGLSTEQRNNINKTGCFIVRNVIPEDETNQLYRDLTTYVADNRDNIAGWPTESPSMLMLYDSPTQNTIRGHSRQLGLQRLLNGLWHDETGETSPDPLLFMDGVRDREPGQPFIGLGPHIDAGSLCRWADPKYRKVYNSIFSGQALQHDPWDLSVRKDADQDLYEGPAHSTVLRSFQGWTALTRTAPNEGTLLLYPSLVPTIAYVVLRPFFKPSSDPAADMMDPKTWTLDQSGFFPGTEKPQSQYLSRSSHPHLRLEECLVHIPEMQAGDTVWWHCDLCHAVDPVHEGKENAAVVYIGACPTTSINKKYVKAQLEATMAGLPPPDYADSKSCEAKFMGYKGHHGLNDEAFRAFGYGL